jgi:ankyrin repeat protein
LETVEFLLDRGADLEATAAQNATPLYTAVAYGHFDIAALLLDRGAQINARSAWNGTPLHMALFSGHQHNH